MREEGEAVRISKRERTLREERRNPQGDLYSSDCVRISYRNLTPYIQNESGVLIYYSASSEFRYHSQVTHLTHMTLQNRRCSLRIVSTVSVPILCVITMTCDLVEKPNNRTFLQ